MRRLNLGILAHVDAGKTTLSEQLLFATGATRELGSVDAGTTQTDSLAMERERGITIRAAVASFVIGDVTVNLIDTPGHPDFISEVERVLSVLDGAVLVLSAVDGVQSQTTLLMRALKRLSIPTLLFVNKIDCLGADPDRVLKAIAQRLSASVIPMGGVEGDGLPDARFQPASLEEPRFRTQLTELLAEHDEFVLSEYVEDHRIPPEKLYDAFAQQIARAVVYPVFYGSAMTGEGLNSLMDGIKGLLPAAAADADSSLSASAFKIERSEAGERVAYVRVFTGRIQTRDRVHFGEDREGKVTAIRVFDGGALVPRPVVVAGEIAKLWGLDEVQVGDHIGNAPALRSQHRFPPPTVEAVVTPNNPEDRGRLRVALGQLADQDPLIGVRQDDRRQELSVSLYGEVQRQVVEETLERDYGIAVTCRETTPIYVERPQGIGDGLEVLFVDPNPFLATIGLRIEPGPAGSGLDFRLDVDSSVIPLYIYKRRAAFADHMREYVRESLNEGLYGWMVIDCIVTMTQCTYSSPGGPPSLRGPLSTAADFRNLTPPVVMRALREAGSVVCEPAVRATVEIPTDTLSVLVPTLGRFGASVENTSVNATLTTITTTLSAANTQELQRQLPRLTRGEGVIESEFTGYQAVDGEPPARARTTTDPLNWNEYATATSRRDLLS